MAEKSLGVLGTTIATAVGGLVIVGVTALFAYLWPNNEAAASIVHSGKAMWSWIGSAASAVWGVVSYPLPAWLAVLVVAACVWGLTREGQESRPEDLAPAKLPDGGTKVLELLIVADGQSLFVEVVARALGVRRLRVESIAEQLHALGLLLSTRQAGDGMLQLSAAGRDYAFAHRLEGDDAMSEDLKIAIRSTRTIWMR